MSSLYRVIHVAWLSRMIVGTSTGVRRTELAQLKVSDVDSKRMVIHIRGGKGRKDRNLMLSPVLLAALREYWRGPKHRPTEWLFPGTHIHAADY